MRAGGAWLTASVEQGATRLTRVSHRAPARLLPMRTAAARAAGGAVCALGSYGGGLLGGDEVALHVHARRGASLALTTQASTKVYRARGDGRAAKQTLDATVEEGALLVVAPDAIVPYWDAAYEGHQRFTLERGASVVAVEWMGAGRVGRGERWAFREYASRSEVRLGDGAPAALVEAVALRGGASGGASDAFDIGGVERDTVASVIAVGPRAAAVGERLRDAAARLAARRMRAARSGGGIKSAALDDADEAPGERGFELFGDVIVGASEVPCGAAADADGDELVATVARVVAQYPEDVSRLLWHCLRPLEDDFGAAPYADRVHAAATAPPALAVPPAVPPSSGSLFEGLPPPAPAPSEDVAATPAPATAAQRLRLCQLTDATLPTGGFAHSAGLEAAVQLGVVGKGGAGLRSFVIAAARSAAQQQAPFVVAAHAAVHAAAASGGGATALDEWAALDAQLHALLAPTAPACRASKLQGGALARISEAWLGGSGDGNGGVVPLARALKARGGHAATVLGALSALLDLPLDASLDAFVHTTARDILSAAVRMNVVGPLAAVPLHAAVIEEAAIVVDGLPGCERAAGGAPLLDAAHACHDILERRLFLT